MLECVPNVSEGRRRDAIERIAAASGDCLLDVHVDPDHNRSVFTLVADEAFEVERCARWLAHAVTRYTGDTWHEGVHPRIGALDVVPFVALSGTADERAIAARAAHDFAQWLAGTLDVPTFLFGDADPERRSLPSLRRDAFVRRAPDFGPGEPHPALGATAVGARPALVAVNCVLDSHDVELASRIAHDVRERDGGLPGVRALGFELTSRRRAQVSMNLTALAATGVEQACTEVRRLARRAGAEVTGVELVGLLPRAELERSSPEFRRWAGLSDGLTIEGRIESHELGRKPG